MSIVKLILTTLLSAAALFVTAKLTGHKQLAQFDFFDYISGITVGSIAAELATELEEPEKPFIAMVIYGIISVSLGIISRKLPKARKYINGSPTIIMNNGKIYRKNMKKAKLDLSEFMLLCREAGYFDLAEIQTAVFEPNGKLSVLPKSQSRPVTPNDLKLETAESEIGTEVIMDGRILHENLKRKGLDLKWLEKQLHSQGYSSEKDVFLAVCGTENSLTLFGYE